VRKFLVAIMFFLSWHDSFESNLCHGQCQLCCFSVSGRRSKFPNTNKKLHLKHAPLFFSYLLLRRLRARLSFFLFPFLLIKNIREEALCFDGKTPDNFNASLEPESDSRHHSHEHFRFRTELLIPLRNL
jgi:hypothetical protein